MALIHNKIFKGIAPRIAARKLPDSNAQVANNVDIWSGEIRSLRDNVQVNIPFHTFDIETIYLLDTLWLAWDVDVDVVRTPVSIGTDTRIHYTGHYNPKSTDPVLAATGGNKYPEEYYNLGLPAPDTVPDVAEQGAPGTDPVVTRNYVYTFVTQWGEEGPPSDPTADATFASDSTWRIGGVTGMSTAPLNTGSITNIVVGGGVSTFTTSANHSLLTGDYVDFSGITGTGGLPGAFNGAGYFQVTRLSATTFSVALAPSGTYTSGGTWSREADYNTTNMKKRIYRTVTGGFYRFVAEIDAATTFYDDNISDTSLGEELPSTTWVNPPADMKGLITLPNGSLAGFTGNTLHMSEPYAPHAWPADYDIAFPYPVVAIAAAGESIIVATNGNPFLVTGANPASMSQTELEIFQACVSKTSMVSILNGAIYASPDGLVYVPVAGTPRVITNGLYKEVDWRLVNPSSIKAYKYNDRYYASYVNGGENDDEDGFLVFDPSEPDSTLTTLGVIITAAHSDLETDSLYFCEDNIIKLFNEGGGFKQFTWRSKVHTSARPIVLQAAQVKFEQGEGLTESEIEAAIQAALATLESQIFFPNGNPLAPDFDNPTHSGAFTGYTPSAYAVAGGPYFDATKEIVTTVTVNLKVITNEGDEEYSYSVSDSKPFRINTQKLRDIFEYEVSGRNATIHEVTIAETLSEIARV